jgi:hypothetical protein
MWAKIAAMMRSGVMRAFGFEPGKVYVFIFDSRYVSEDLVDMLSRELNRLSIRGIFVMTENGQGITALEVTKDDLRKAIGYLEEQESHGRV